MSSCHHIIWSCTIKVIWNWNIRLHWIFPNILASTSIHDLVVWDGKRWSTPQKSKRRKIDRWMNLLWKLHSRTERDAIKYYQHLVTTNTNCYYQKRLKTLLDQHIVSGLICMKNSYFYMMKFKHGCRKNNKFLMKKVFEREMKKLWYLSRVLRSGS